MNKIHRIGAMLITAGLFTGCLSNQDNGSQHLAGNKRDNCCGDDTTLLSCKLTSPEMQERKATVLVSLRKQLLEKTELENGYSFKFPGNDRMIDELTEFVKSERQCCDFLTFNISLSGDTSAVWLDITGPSKTKEFIITELEL